MTLQDFDNYNRYYDLDLDPLMLRNDLFSALNGKVSSKDVTLLILVTGKGKTYKSLSEKLGTPVNVVRKRVESALPDVRFSPSTRVMLRNHIY